MQISDLGHDQKKAELDYLQQSAAGWLSAAMHVSEESALFQFLD